MPVGHILSLSATSWLVIIKDDFACRATASNSFPSSLIQHRLLEALFVELPIRNSCLACSEDLPVKVGTMLSESRSGGKGALASSACSGHPIAEVADVIRDRARRNVPGHQARKGTRIPPSSVRLRLIPENGPAGWKRVRSWLLSSCGPLSL